ncbi:MAG: rhodanese-like domain-containing protein [Chloroflexota bacterium]
MTHSFFWPTILLLAGFVLLSACGPQPDESLSEGEVPAEVNVANLAPSIDVQTAAALLDNDDVVFLDVREQWEYDQGHIPGITLIPMSEFEARVSEVPEDKTVILTCRSGNRSGQVDTYLRGLGYDNIHNMEGGIIAWEAAGLEVVR